MDLTAVLAAAGGEDKGRRDEAEAYLKQFEAADPGRYFVSLVQALVDATKAPGMRQLAGVMIKNGLDAQDDTLHQKKIERWLALDPALRTQVKQALLSGLAADDILPRKAAAQAIAKVGGIELASGQWKDLVSMLLTHAVNPALPTGPLHAVLMTLGFLLEEIEPEHLDPGQIDQILGCFVMGLAAGKPVEVQRVSATAMVAALPFASANFEDDKKEQRDVIMGAICNGTQVPDIDVRLAAFDCIILVASLYYSKLQSYMGALFSITTASVTQEEPIGIRAIEFWNTVCEVEIGILNGEITLESKNFAKLALPTLVPLMTQCMVKQPEEYDEQMTLSMAASLNIALIAQVTGNDCLPLVGAFVQPAFDSPDWHYREAGAMAIGSIMEGPEAAALTPFIKHFLPIMISRISLSAPGPGGAVLYVEPHVSVRDTIAWAIGKVVLNQINQLDDATLNTIVDVICGCLKDEPRVVVNACYAINVLASELAEVGRQGILSPKLPAVVKCLGDAQARDDWDESNMRDSCWAAISELLKGSTDADIPFVQAVLSYSLQMLNTSVVKPITSADDRDEQFSLQSALCGAIQVIINRLASGIEPSANDIMAALHRLFSVPGNTAVEDGLMAVSALANHAGSMFPSYLDAIHPILLKCLQEHEEYSICVAASVALGDIARSVGTAILKYSNEYVSVLIRNLSNPDLNRIVKPPQLSAFGDLALATGAEFKLYFPHIIKILVGAAEVTGDPEDEDEMEFVFQLRQAVLEAYTGIAQAYATTNSGDVAPYLPAIVSLCERISNEAEAGGPNAYQEGFYPDLIRGCVGLLGDLALSMDKSLWVALFSSRVPWVGRLYNWLSALEAADGVSKETSVAAWAFQNLRV